MEEKLNWFPIDTRIFPFGFSLHYPKSRVVRTALFLEFLLAFFSVVGTLLLIILPPPQIQRTTTQATTESAPATPPGCR